MLKLIAQNKYKLMGFIIGLYLLVDVLQHKGQTRVLFPKDFSEPDYVIMQLHSTSKIVNKNKNWKKGINTREQLNKLNIELAGFECDVYFDTVTRSFDVQHDADKSIGYKLNDLLQLHQQKKMQAGIWLDIKNLHDSNAALILRELIKLRNEYGLMDRLLVESGRADLLTAFSDSNFFTSYYVPFFNPYTINKKELTLWGDSIASVISKSRINALSGYYFQSSFLSHYFYQYKVLTWVDEFSFSLVNMLFQRKISADTSVFIVLKP